MTLSLHDPASLPEIIEEMRHLTLQEGLLYRCRHDTMIEFRDDVSKNRVVEEGTAVVAIHGPTGEEAVLVDGVVVPFPWAENCIRNLFEPIDE